MSLLLHTELPENVSEREACEALEICRNSLRAARVRYHSCGPASPYRRRRKETHQPRALSGAERDSVVEVLTNEPYHDQPPAQVYYSLLQ